MDKKIVVIYKSKYGSSKRYAGWIALKLDADLYEIDDIHPKALNDYDTIIYGSGIYSGCMNSLKFIYRNFERIKDKEIIIFGVGLKSNNNMVDVLEKHLSEEMISKVKMFSFVGGINHDTISKYDKFLLYIYKYKNDKSQNKDLDIKLFDKTIDLCDKKSIHKLINSVNSLSIIYK